MNSKEGIPGPLQFGSIIILVAALCASFNVAYFLVWVSLIDIPVPDPFTENYIIIQSVIVVVVSGIIYYYNRITMYESAFNYLKTVLIQVIFNAAFFYITMDLRLMPSINEIKRLFGDAGAPIELLWLSVPVALVPAIGGIFGIPYFIWRSRKGTNRERIVLGYRHVLFQLFKAYFIVVVLLLAVNVAYYFAYKSLGGPMPDRFELSQLLQMTFVLTAVSAVMFLYLRDNAKNGLSIWLILTICIAISAFLAGLPIGEDGKPMFDETLGLNAPITAFSLVAELVGIPYFFKASFGEDSKPRLLK